MSSRHSMHYAILIALAVTATTPSTEIQVAVAREGHTTIIRWTPPGPAWIIVERPDRDVPILLATTPPVHIRGGDVQTTIRPCDRIRVQRLDADGVVAGVGRGRVPGCVAWLPMVWYD